MPKLRLLHLVLCYSFFITSSAYSNNVDSILLVINASDDIEEKIQLYFELSKFDNTEESYTYANKAHDLAIDSKNDFMMFKIIYRKSIIKLELDEFNEALTLLNEALDRYDNLSGSEKQSKRHLRAELLERIGWITAINLEYYEAIHYYNEALEIRNETGTRTGFLSASIGYILKKIGDYDLAKEYFKESSRIYKERKNFKHLIVSYLNLGITHNKTKDYSLALVQFRKALEIIEEKEIYGDKYNTIFNAALTKYYLGNYDDALNDFELTRNYHLDSGNETVVAHCQTYISKIKFIREKDTSTLPVLLGAYNTALKYPETYRSVIDIKLESTKSISDVYAALGNYSKALEYNKLFHKIEDSISNKELLLKIRSIDLKNKFEVQQQTLETAKKAELLETKLDYQYKLTGALVLFLSSILYILFRLFKAHRANKEIRDKLIIKNDSLKLTEQLLQESNRDMKEYIGINKELEQFAYMASHDIKAPLRTIQSFSSLLKNKFYDQAELTDRDCFDFVEKATNNLNLLVNDLLAYSKSNTKELNIEQIDFSKILNEVILLLNFSISEANAKINYHNVNIILHADKIKLKQVLQNVISNAIKFRDANRQPNIYITVDESEAYYSISVKDNGIGIEQDYFEKVFEKFARLNSTDQYEGTGLGLAICAKYVKEHKGQMSIRKNSDYGVTFSFSISKELKGTAPSLTTV